MHRCTFHDGITLIAIIYLHVLCQLRNTFYELYLRSSTSWATCDVFMLNFIGKKKSHDIYVSLCTGKYARRYCVNASNRFVTRSLIYLEWLTPNFCAFYTKLFWTNRICIVYAYINNMLSVSAWKGFFFTFWS